MAIIVKEHISLFDAIEQMQREKARLIFVVDHSDSLVGVISQGDLLKISNLSISINSCMEMNPVYVFDKDRSRALEVMKQYKFSEIPILNEEFTILEVVTIWELV
jgi:Mg/Co/Ni transporter MgtE